MVVLPLAGKGRGRPGEQDDAEAKHKANDRPSPRGPPRTVAVDLVPQDLAPQPPQEPKIGEQDHAMGPGNEATVKRQELDLHHEQQKDRRDHQRDPGDSAQRRAKKAAANVRRSSKKLDENVAR
jgi:hypothetical protein